MASTNQEIIDYISQAQKHGLSEFEIKQNLLSAGWEAELVEQSFVFIKAAENRAGEQVMRQETATAAQPIKQQPQPVSRQVLPANLQPIASAAVQPQISNPSQPAAKPAPAKKSLKAPVLVVVVLLLLCGGGAFAYYKFVAINPTAIWQKFTQNTSQPIYQTQYSISYSDSAKKASTTDTSALKNINLRLDGNGYVNVQDPNNPQSNSKVQYTFSSGDTSFSTALEYTMLNNALYINAGNNPFLNALGAGQSQWIKIDLNRAQSQPSQTQEQTQMLEMLSNPQLKLRLQQIWQNTTLVKIDNYVGKETVNGVTTLHFQNSLDSIALQNLIFQYVDAIAQASQATGNKINPQDTAAAKQTVNQLINKIRITDFETWVGLNDFKLYQVKLSTNAPSVLSLVKNLQASMAPQTSDAKRISDMRQMAVAFELYFGDHNGSYPEAQNGVPVGLSPKYMSIVPTAPAADGQCTNYYNTYWYTPTGKKMVNGKPVYTSYDLTFCLGAATNQYKAGIAKLTNGVITDSLPCPSTPQQCINSNAPAPQVAQSQIDQQQQVQNFASKIDFSANLTFNATYSNYGQLQQLTQPANYIDLLQKLQASTSTPTSNQSATN